MKNKKILVAMFVIVIISGGFYLRSYTSSESHTGLYINFEEIDKLPEEEKEKEIDNALANIRKFRKDAINSINFEEIDKVPNTQEKKEDDGILSYDSSEFEISMSNGSSEEIKNRPTFSGKEYMEILDVAFPYIIDILGIDENDNEAIQRIDMDECIDPRINKIYDEKDKGVANGYQNKDIHVMEYESTGGIYKYLFLGRDSKTKKWKILHDGLSYKE